jgi:hypothetical protein
MVIRKGNGNNGGSCFVLQEVCGHVEAVKSGGTM